MKAFCRQITAVKCHEINCMVLQARYKNNFHIKKHAALGNIISQATKLLALTCTWNHKKV